MMIADTAQRHVDREAVRRFLERWAATTDRRLRAAHPQRPAWDACRRKIFIGQLQEDCPALSERQRMAVFAAFDAAAERAVVRAAPLPPLALPGRVSTLVARLDVGNVIDGG